MISRLESIGLVLDGIQFKEAIVEHTGTDMLQKGSLQDTFNILKKYRTELSEV